MSASVLLWADGNWIMFLNMIFLKIEFLCSVIEVYEMSSGSPCEISDMVLV
jgi:hypothetical protein